MKIKRVVLSRNGLLLVLAALFLYPFTFNAAFGPATNLIVLRRLSLKVGQKADAPAAYLQFPEMQLVLLPQSYQRVGRMKYRYEAPSVDYSETLHVLPSGAVILYPGLFEQVTSG